MKTWGNNKTKKTKHKHAHAHTKQNKTDENQSDYTSNTHKNKRGINPHPQLTRKFTQNPKPDLAAWRSSCCFRSFSTMGSSSCLKSSFCCDLNPKKPTKISTITERSHRDNRDRESGNCLCKRKKLRANAFERIFADSFSLTSTLASLKSTASVVTRTSLEVVVRLPPCFFCFFFPLSVLDFFFPPPPPISFLEEKVRKQESQLLLMKKISLRKTNQLSCSCCFREDLKWVLDVGSWVLR